MTDFRDDSPKQEMHDKAVRHAVHQALYYSLKLLDTPESPLGGDADEARSALRRAWVATHHNPLYDDVIHDAPTERAMFNLWRKERAEEIARSDV